ncbi:MAG TPA: ABC transporter substrate-binding protein [Rhizomicrobium sp.]|nr:ABC transporter substrate-binding protein [Rhizomicrobium sp.]
MAHGWHVGLIAALLALAPPAFAAPQHVVSLLVCTDEYVYRLLPRERIAALSYLAADRHPVVSTIAGRVKGIPLIHQDAESVLAKHPDLVITYRYVNQKLHAVLAAAGIRVYDVPMANSLADIRGITRALGEVLGEQTRAERLIADMDAKLAAARMRAPAPPVATLIYEPNGYVTGGGVTDEVLRAGGMRDAGPRMHQARNGTVPVEMIVADPPELLVLNDAKEATPAQADLILRHPALAALKGRVAVAHLSLTPLLCPGPWSADAAAPLEALAERARLRAPAARPKN